MNTMPASRRSRFILPVAGLMLLALLLAPASLAVASDTSAASTTAASADETPVPGQLSYVVADGEPTISTIPPPWLTQEQLYYNPDKSVFWNAYYRGGQGQVQLRGVEYINYDYNNRTDTADTGTLDEIHHMLMLSGSPLPYVQLFAGAGINTLRIDPSNDGRENPLTYTGLTFDIGLQLGGPIPGVEEFLTLELGARYREYNSSEGTSAPRDDMYGQWWRGWVHVAVEPLGNRAGFSWTVYAGAGYSYVRQRWNFGGTVERISPNNNAALSNGPERIDITAGMRFIFAEAVSLDLEARFVGPLTIIGGITIII